MEISRMPNSLRRMAIATLVLAWACLVPHAARAGHIAGVDITYECINSCTVRVHFKAFRDCSSSITNISPLTTLIFTADPGCVMPVRITPWINASNQEVTPVCPGTPTLCNSPLATINGMMEHYWYADFDFCAANCADYEIHWQTCCRNNSITTLNNPASVALFTSATVHPLLSPCNSAPVFNNPPVPIICRGQNYVFSQGATDPDGDSLAYSLGPCMRDSVNSVPYVAYANPILPLGPNWTVNLNGATGDLFIAPDPNGTNPGAIEIGVICVYVQEWRGGQLINTIVRDLQLTVVPCAPNDPPTTFGIASISGGIETGHYSAKTCLGATLCFDFKVLDSDLAQTQTVYWNQSLAALGATFSLSTNPAIVDTIVGQLPIVRFCWTPTVPGSYNFTVVMHDDACPIYGISQYNFQIEVDEIHVAAIDSVIGCKVVGLCASTLADHYPLSFSWVGPGGLTGNPGHLDSCLNHNYPSSGTFPYTLTLEDAIGCTAVWQDTVVIPNNVVADAGPDMSTCANQPLVIGNPPQISQLLTYAWTPTSSLTNPNSAQPTVTLANSSLSPLTQLYVLSIQDTVTYCVDSDTMLVTVYPIPGSSFNLQDSACQNQIVGVVYSGSNPASANFNWTFAGAANPTMTGIGPHQVSWPTPGAHEVTLTVEQNGCFSPVERDTIFVKTNPVSQILPVGGQCLVSNSFNFSTFGTFGPTATHNWTFWPNAVPATSNLPAPTGIVFGTAGPKWVTVSTTDNGCTSATDSLLVQVYPDPDALWGIVGGVQCFSGNSYHFIAHAGNGPTATYNWTFQDGNPISSTDTLPIVSFLSPGPKTVTLTVTAFGCTATHTSTVMVFPEPLLATGPDTSFCEGEGGVVLSALASSGTAPFYYTWTCAGGICGIDSIFDDDPLVNPSGSSYFYGQVTDANGCTSPLDSVYVTIHAKPIVNAGPDLRLCGLNSPCEILLPSVSGTGPFGFEWFPAVGLNDSSLFNPCARPDTTTIYVLLATELSTGCRSDYNTLDTNASVTVHVNPVPVADAGPDIDICDGQATIIPGFGSGAGPVYAYQWTPAAGLSLNNIANPLAAPATTTVYSLVVWSNDCPSAADNVTVEVHTMPSVDAGWNQEICLGESILLDATAAGDSTALYSFHWSTALGLNDPFLEDPTATPPMSTTYFVVATSNWGCSSAADSVRIELRPTPVATAGGDTSICFGQSLHLQGGYVYGATDSVSDPSQILFAWSPNAQGMNDSTLASPTIAPSISGMYYLHVLYSVCRTQDSVLVLVIPELGAQITGDTATICNGDSVQLHASGGLGSAQYAWSPAGAVSNPTVQHPTVFPSDTTAYTLILSESGCHDTTSFMLNVIPSPQASFLHSPARGCVPLTVSFLENTSSAIAYVWDFGDGSAVSNAASPVHTFSEPGSYVTHFSAVHSGGCEAEAEPLVVEVLQPSQPIVHSQPVAPTILYLPAATVQVQELGPTSTDWIWNFGDGFQAQGALATHSYTEPGLYFVQLHSSNAEGCTSVSEIGPFEVRAPDLFIPNVFSPNGDGVNDRYLVNYTGDQPFTLEIKDRWGVTLYRSNQKNTGWDGNFGGEPAPDGVYYYWLKISDKAYTGNLTLLR